MKIKLTIGKQIIGGFALVLLLLITLSVVSILTVSSSSEGFSSFQTISQKGSDIARLRSDIISLNASVSDYLVYKTPDRRAEFDNLLVKTDKEIKELQKVAKGSKHEKQVKVLAERRQSYVETTAKIFDLLDQENKLLVEVINPKGKKADKFSKQLFDKLSLDNVVTGMRNSASAIRKYLRGRYYVGQLATFVTEENRDSAREEFKGLQQIFGSLESNLSKKAHTSRLRRFKDNFIAYNEGFESLQAILFKRHKLVNEELNVIAEEMLGDAEKLINLYLNDQVTLGNELKASNQQAELMLVALSLGACLLAIGLAILIVRGITKPLTKSVDGLYAAVKQVSSAANFILSSSSKLADGTSAQIDSLNETTESLSDIENTAKENLSATTNAQDLSLESKASADKGVEMVEEMSSAMDEIKSSSEQVADIVGIIDSIAFQTNLLALNAAVEAARAGDAGKGFAVVAEEVRNLAKRSADSAKETSDKISSSLEKSEEGVKICEQVFKQLKEIAAGASKIEEVLKVISKGSAEQSSGVSNIADSLRHIDGVTQESAAGAQENSSAASQLTAEAKNVAKVAEELNTLLRG